MQSIPRVRLYCLISAWLLRIAAIGFFSCMFIPKWKYELTSTYERASFELGWPHVYYSNKMTVAFNCFYHPGKKPDYPILLHGWTLAHRRDVPIGSKYGNWGFERKTFGPSLFEFPVWQTGVGVILLMIASYLAQFKGDRAQTLGQAASDA